MSACSKQEDGIDLENQLSPKIKCRSAQNQPTDIIEYCDRVALPGAQRNDIKRKLCYFAPKLIEIEEHWA